MFQLGLGACIAFLVASIVIVQDLHSELNATRRYVPYSVLGVLKIPSALVLASVCGILSALVFCFVDPKDLSSVFSVIFTFGITSPLLRGTVTGLMVMFFIRSKLATVGGKAVGLELIYVSVRSEVLRNAVKRWGDYKSKFVSRQLLAEVLTIKNFADDLITKYEHAVFLENKAQDTAWREVVTRIVKTRRPKKAVAECQKEWLAYLEILIETILDYGGETSILEVLSIHRKHQEVVQIREGTALNQSGSSTEGGPPAPR